MRTSVLAGAFVATITVLACKRESPATVDAGASAVTPERTGTAAPSGAPASSSTPLALDDEARDVVAVVRSSHAIACSVANNDASARCHDEVKGFAAARKCYVDGLEVAKRAQAKKPSPVARFPCGKSIEAATLGYLDSVVALMTDSIAWLDAHKAALTSSMAGKTFADACDEPVSCADFPMEFDEKHSGASWAAISAIECTKPLLQCGAPDNVCWVDKVAERLGLACDSTENKPNDLRVRATGTVLR